MEQILSFDIETYGAWDDLDPELQSYLEQRDRNRGRRPDDPRAVSTRVGLLPGLARVIAVGLWSGPGSGTRLSLVPTLRVAQERSDSGDYRLVRFREEKDLLTEFWSLIGHAVDRDTRLVSFNGRCFDGPMLSLRSALLGVTPSVNLTPPRGEVRPHCDMSDLLSFFGASRSYSLNYWCHVYGVASPKGEMNGAQVAEAFERGDYDSIARYALGDAIATGEIFRRVEPSLLATLEATRE